MSGKAEGATIRVRQTKSGIGFNVRQKKTLKALGLGKVNRTRELPNNASVRGMLAKVPHLVTVLDGADEDA
jgi:large subunit ribosomal protein L30